MCGSCEARPPSVLTTLPGYVSKAGIPIPIWLCSVCLELIPEPLAAPRKKPRKRVGRVSAGRYGKAVMGLAYRFGGFTASQLGEMLLRENPSRFARSKATPERAAFASARDTLLLLRENRLMDSVGVWREHAVGERGGRIEEFYYLSPKGVQWGASQNDVVDSTEAKEAYERHQLPKEAEHAAYRNDIYLWMLRDFELERSLHDDEEMRKRYASEVVVSNLADFSGESDEQYPYIVGAFKNRRASPGTALRGRTVERLFPDGRARVIWADEFEGEFDFEAERESKARKAAGKVDRYGAYWLRLYREMEDEAHAPRVRPLEEQAARIEEERARLKPLQTGEGVPKEIRRRAITRLTGENPDTGKQEEVELLVGEEPDITVARLEELRKEIAAIKKTPLPFMGLPEEVVPVVFVHQSKQRSENTRQKLRDREYPMPRFEEFITYMRERMIGWARERIFEINQKRIAAGEEPVRFDFGGYAATYLDKLLVFTSWEELRQEAESQLDGEDSPELHTGSTLWPIYTPLHSESSAGRVSLREASSFREKLRPSEVKKATPNT